MVSCEPSPHIERVAEELRGRGFDARAFTDTDELGCQPESGVTIHGICVLGWRYPNGRWEFTDRPPRLIEPDEHDPTGRWTWDDILACSGDRRQLAVTISDAPRVVAARVVELLPCDVERPQCRSFPDLWTWKNFPGSGGDEAPKQWDRAWRNRLVTLTSPTDSPPRQQTRNEGDQDERTWPGPSMISSDPTHLVTTIADAMTVAGALLHTPRAGLDCDSIWTSAAEWPLSAMLYAASACGNGKGIGWVKLAVDNLEKDDNRADAPGWYSAAEAVGDQPLFRDALLRTLDLNPVQRESILMTMRDALWPWIQPRKGLDG